MKRNLTIAAVVAAILLAIALCSRCSAAHVQFNWSQFNLETARLTNRVFWITPMSAPAGSGNLVISGDRRPYTNSATATATASNMLTGAYKVDLTGPYVQTTFLICVPDTNALIQASTIICSHTNLPTAGSLAYSSSVSDLRYVQNILAGTNIMIEYLGAGVFRINSMGGTSAPPAALTYYLLTAGGDNLTTAGGDRLVWTK